MASSKRGKIRAAVGWLAVAAVAAAVAAFPGGWGAKLATAVIRHYMAESGGTCEKVVWISPFTFEARGFSFPGMPGDIRLEKVEARYSPRSLLGERRVKALDASGFSMDLSGVMKPEAAALFKSHRIVGDAHVRPSSGEGMVVSANADALDWSLHGDALVKVVASNGLVVACEGRASVKDSPWAASLSFQATTNGWSFSADIDETYFDQSTPVVGEIASRAPMPGVTNLAFSGVASAVAVASQTKAMPVPVWRAEAVVGSFSAALDSSGTPIVAEGGGVKVKASGIADHWDVEPMYLRLDHVGIAGFDFDKVFATLLVSESDLLVTESRADFCGGNVRVYALKLKPETLDAGFTLLLDNIDTGEFLARLPDFHGSATGRLHGKIPLAIHRGEAVRFRNAYLFSTPGEVGKLRIFDASPIIDNLAAAGALSQADCDSLAAALADLDYTVLRLELTRDGLEDDTLSVRVEGTSTQGKTVVPVKLAVKFHGAIERLVNFGIRAASQGRR